MYLLFYVYVLAVSAGICPVSVPAADVAEHDPAAPQDVELTSCSKVEVRLIATSPMLLEKPSVHIYIYIYRRSSSM